MNRTRETKCSEKTSTVANSLGVITETIRFAPSVAVDFFAYENRIYTKAD